MLLRDAKTVAALRGLNEQDLISARG
jgi:hypothetical protein